MLPGCLGWERFVEALKPCDLILTLRLKFRDRAQKHLLERHEEYLLDTSIPLLYRPEDARRQNIIVTIPGPSPENRPNQQELVLNDVIEVNEICPRGPRRHVGLGLGSWLCHHSPLEPRSHHCRHAKGLDHR